MRNYKIRFNLGRGENYQKWKITNNRTEESFYLLPEEFNLELVGCTLRNQKGTAERIYNGSNKTVCAWIDCDDIVVRTHRHLVGTNLEYNPRVSPNWLLEGDDVDNEIFDKLETYGKLILL